MAAPFLDVLLAVGERISRIAEPTDHEYYPIRPGGEQRLPGEVGGADAGGGVTDEVVDVAAEDVIEEG